MELHIDGNFTKLLFAKSKKDPKLAQALAKNLISTVNPVEMARFLLEGDAAIELLAQRLKGDPDKTVKALQAMSVGVTPPRRGRPPGRPAKTADDSAAKVSKKRRKRGRRSRLTDNDVEQLKNEVREYLTVHPWSTRKDLTTHIALNTQAIYRRIMLELLGKGEVISEGEKAKAVYALRGTKKGAEGRAPKEAKPAKKGKRGRRKKNGVKKVRAKASKRGRKPGKRGPGRKKEMKVQETVVEVQPKEPSIEQPIN